MAGRTRTDRFQQLLPRLKHSNMYKLQEHLPAQVSWNHMERDFLYSLSMWFQEKVSLPEAYTRSLFIELQLTPRFTSPTPLPSSLGGTAFVLVLGTTFFCRHPRNMPEAARGALVKRIGSRASIFGAYLCHWHSWSGLKQFWGLCK